MCNTLAHIILPMLIQLKATKHGVPAAIIGEDIETDENGLTNEGLGRASEKWDRIMDQMIWSFKQVINEELSDGETNSPEYLIYQERIDEGLALFGKYYRCLWD